MNYMNLSIIRFDRYSLDKRFVNDIDDYTSFPRAFPRYLLLINYPFIFTPRSKSRLERCVRRKKKIKEGDDC